MSNRVNPEWGDLQTYGDSLVGSVVGTRYELLELIGAGVGGRAYRALDLQLGREFCVKILNSRASRQRVDREVRAMANIRSPHAVGLVGTSTSGPHTAVVMDFVPGVTVQRELEARERLTVPEALTIAEHVALALAAAHKQGIVHRDIKPSNVMIQWLPSGDMFAQVLDFGLAKFLEDSSVTAGFVGTPVYASPEQLSGEPVSASSDLYSLGCMLFEMLTGRAPFAAADVVSLTLAHFGEERPKLSDVDPRFQMHPELERFVASLIARAPMSRPRSAESCIRVIGLLKRLFEAAGESAAPEDELSAQTTCTAANEGYVIYGTRDGRVERLDIPSGKRTLLMEDPRRDPIAVVEVFGSRVLAASTSGRTWLVQPHGCEFKRVGSGAPVVELATSEDETTFAVRRIDGSITVICKRERFDIRATRPVETIALSEHGSHLATWGRGLLQIFEARTGRVVQNIVHPDQPRGFHYSSAAGRFVTASIHPGDAQAELIALH